MRQINRDSLPHLTECMRRIVVIQLHTFWTLITTWWWDVDLGYGCKFDGQTRFRRHPGSVLSIGNKCKFNSSPVSNYIGVNRPCTLSTLNEDAKIKIGSNCGFSGTVIGCASEVVIDDNVMCGANTLITDTDWHSDDPRSGPDAPVRIENDVWLGVNVTVLKGVTIGENTLVAAGSVVVNSLPPNVIAGGVPAKVIRTIEQD